MRYRDEHEKIKFISTSGHVKSSIYLLFTFIDLSIHCHYYYMYYRFMGNFMPGSAAKTKITRM